MSSAPIVVALSGGVDSATAAALLVEEGHRVVGMTMRLYDARGTSASSGGRCCGPRDIEDARMVCDHLGIPFYVVDFAQEFREAVIDDFVAAYQEGLTPNPCVRCNQHIKFTPLLHRARQLGADYLATGHYAQLQHQDEGVVLRRGKDLGKDQSYFLFSMPAHELPYIQFPLGHLDKEEVRALAARCGLPNAQKAESQEICFVPDGDYGAFVEKVSGNRIPVAGDIVTEDGVVVGRHRGIHRYTLGQRRGLGNLNISGKPVVYVVDIDKDRNRVVVGPHWKAQTTAIEVQDFRWLAPEPLRRGECRVQVRHGGQTVPCTLSASGDTAHAELRDDVLAAPGQSAVFYVDDIVIGGGWIAPKAQARHSEGNALRQINSHGEMR